MFSAFGRAITRDADGIASVTIEYVREADNKPVLKATYPFTTRQAVKALVDTQLQQLKQAEEDATISSQFIDVLISRI